MGHSAFAKPSLIMASFKILFPLAFVLTIFSQSEATLRGDFCSDVSFWDVVTFKEEQRCCSDIASDIQCETKTEEVCKDVTEMKCQAVAWVECKPDPNAAAPGGCHEKYKDYELKKSRTATPSGTSMITATRFGLEGKAAPPCPGRSATLSRRRWTLLLRRPIASLPATSSTSTLRTVCPTLTPW